MATLQLAEGYTVRKVGKSLKVVIAKKKTMDSMEELNRKHEETMAKVYAQRAAEKAEKERRYTEAFQNPPALSGSVKQVEWASKIRAAFIEFYQVRRREYCGDEVIAHTDASHWIENRYGMGVTNSDQRAIQALIYAK
jgi:hypothetical protein